MGICVTDGLTGGTLDVNDELMHFCHYPPLHVLLATQPVVGWANVRSQAQMGRAVDEKTADNGRRVGLAADQYGRSWQGLWQLYAGEVNKTDAVWRCCHAPGDKLEMNCSAHVASWEEKDVDGIGELRRVPAVWCGSYQYWMRNGWTNRPLSVQHTVGLTAVTGQRTQCDVKTKYGTSQHLETAHSSNSQSIIDKLRRPVSFGGGKEDCHGCDGRVSTVRRVRACVVCLL